MSSGCGKGCGFNADDPNAPEFGKGYKLENVSQLGCGTNIDVARNQPKDIPEPRIIRSKRTRQDFT